MPDKAWKAAERRVAKALGGERITPGQFGKKGLGDKRPDVLIPEFPNLKVDSKKYKRHAVHSLWKEVNDKYCADESDVAVLVTTEFGKSEMLVTIPASHYRFLLDALQYAQGDASEPYILFGRKHWKR